MPRRTEDDVLLDLERVGRRLELINDERDDLYRRRDDLIVEAREKFEKPITMTRIAAAALMQENALTAARAKIGEKRGSKVR